MITGLTMYNLWTSSEPLHTLNQGSIRRRKGHANKGNNGYTKDTPREKQKDQICYQVNSVITL